MRLAPISAAAVVLTLFHVSTGCAQQAEINSTVRNSGPISFASVEELNQSGTGVVLIGGAEAPTADWPASFYSAAIGSRCSATLIGPTVLLLAAHCVGNAQNAAIKYNGEDFVGPCTHAQQYLAGDDSADYSLCKLNRPVIGILYERLNRDPAVPKVHDFLLLTGYGCTQAPPAGGGPPSGGNDGKFRVGKAKITSLPGSSAEPNTIVTKDKVIVCKGDSGGGAYSEPIPGRRVLVSVNSRTKYASGESLLSSVTSPIALAFFDDWREKAENKDEKICGINLSSAECR